MQPQGRGAQLALHTPTEHLLMMAQGKHPPTPWRERLRRLVCKVVGHQHVKDRWVNRYNLSEFETHHGCLRCDRLVIHTTSSR